jgi:hypothetical protein
MNTEVLPQMNVFMYTVSFHLQVTASLKFDLFKIGAQLDPYVSLGDCYLLKCGPRSRSSWPPLLYSLSYIHHRY